MCAIVYYYEYNKKYIDNVVLPRYAILLSLIIIKIIHRWIVNLYRNKIINSYRLTHYCIFCVHVKISR